MSTVIETPEGVVETGVDFNGNIPDKGQEQLEVGVDFDGNSPLEQPTPVAEVVDSNTD